MIDPSRATTELMKRPRRRLGDDVEALFNRRSLKKPHYLVIDNTTNVALRRTDGAGPGPGSARHSVCPESDSSGAIQLGCQFPKG